MKRWWAIYGAVLAGSLTACTENDPTAALEEVVPDLNPRTVEVRLSGEEFVEEIQVFGGFGSPATMGRSVLARDFQGLNSRALLRFGAFPDSVRVFDATTGTATWDTGFSIVGGRLVLFFDTLQGVEQGPVDLSVSATQERWDAQTANWGVAVDTLGDRDEWSRPGGGITVPVGSGTYDRQAGRPQTDTIPLNDSVSIAVDSTRMAAWADTMDATRGALVALENPNRRVILQGARLRVVVRPRVRPDSLVEETALGGAGSFIYDPVPMPPTEGLRVGGAPSWRSVITLNLPRVLDAQPELCRVVACPFDFVASGAQLNLAELVLTTRQTLPAYQLFNNLNFEVRTVVNRELLPKSPLGSELTGSLAATAAPELFTSLSGAEIEFPLTNLVNDLMLGDSATVATTPNTIVILSAEEPSGLGFAAFQGVGGAGAPVLRLLVTVAGELRFP